MSEQLISSQTSTAQSFPKSTIYKLTDLAKAILPKFPDAIEVQGIWIVLATAMTNDGTKATLLCRSDGYLDINFQGSYISEYSRQFARIYAKHFAALESINN